MLKKALALVAMLYTAVSFAAVDVNKATAAELDSIKGIGPSMSTRIITERKKGDFKDWSDFTARVKGVKDSKATKFSAEGLTVNGNAYKGESIQAVKATKADKAPRVVAPKADEAAMKPGN